MENYFEKEFELRYYDISQSGEASPTTMLALLEETAADHCHSIDYSLYDLEKLNIGWVLLSGFMEMDRYPVYKEKIIIRTWLSTYSLVKGIRENVIYDENRNVIGRAKGLWLFYDIKRRKPVQVFDTIIEHWSTCEEESVNHDIIKKIKPIDFTVEAMEFGVFRFDVDTNKHVNNLRYLQWLLESVPKEIIDNYYLHSIDGRFTGEAQLGETVLSFTQKEESVENSLVHLIKTKNRDVTCALAKTTWKKRIK